MVTFPRHTKGPLVITGHDLNVTAHFYIIADKVHEHDSSREMTVGCKAPYINPMEQNLGNKEAWDIHSMNACCCTIESV